MAVHSICGGLSKNGPHRLVRLNTWSSVGGYLGRVKGVAVLEGGCHWGGL